MPTVTPNVVVSMPSQLFTLSQTFKANAAGKIYIGKIDTDPTITANQIQVYVENEDGSLIPISQPVLINAGGYPVYNGQISKLVTVEGHSMAVFDFYDVQQFYFPNVLKYDPDQFKQELASDAGASLIGTASGDTVQDELDQLNEITNEAILSNIRPLPVRFTSKYSSPMGPSVNPQGMAEDDLYWYTADDVTVTPGNYLCQVSRILKADNTKQTVPVTIGSHGQGIGVIGDGTVFVGGSANSKIAIVNFTNNTVTEQDCIGIYKDFPFCYDQTRKIIYQLQDADITSANMTRLAILDFTAGFKSDCSIDRQIVKAGYPQGIATDGRYIYVTCGDSWASSTGGVWNDYWTLYRMTVGGVVLDRMAYRRNTMGAIINVTAIQHEPQGISYHKGKLSMMQYIGDTTATYNVIFTEDLAGTWVRAIPKNRFVDYNGLTEIAINPAALTTGSSIRTIVASMVDGSTVTFPISNETALTADTGIGGFGTCTVTRVNGSRAYALTVESSSILTANIAPRISIVAVYNVGTVTPIQSAAKMIMGSRKVLTKQYTSGTVAVAGALPITDISTCSNISFHVTNTSGTNPVSVYKFFREEIDTYITDGVSIVLNSPAGSSISLSMNFSATGITINSVTGAVILRSIYTS